MKCFVNTTSTNSTQSYGLTCLIMHCRRPRISFTTFCRNKTDQWHFQPHQLLQTTFKMAKFTPSTNVLPKVKKKAYLLFFFKYTHQILFLHPYVEEEIFSQMSSLKSGTALCGPSIQLKEVRGMLYLVIILILIFWVTDLGNTGRWLQDIDTTARPVELLPLFLQYNKNQVISPETALSVNVEKCMIVP